MRQIEMVEMQNGCICCTLRDEFMAEVAGYAKEIWTKDQYENFLVTHGWRIVNSKEVVARKKA